MLRKETDLGGKKVRYYEAGRGDAVLLLHGAGGTARQWRKQFGPLSELFRVLAPDLPGFGGTDSFPEIKDVRGYAGFISAFLESKGISRVSVVGSSMGGWAACWFALDYPGKIEKLVLVSPAGIFRAEDPPMPMWRLLEEIRLSYGTVVGQAGDAARELESGLATITRLDESGGLEPDLAGRLSMIKADTLIIWGKEDKVIPVTYAGYFVEEIQYSRVSIIEGAGHLPYSEKPDLFNGTVAGFLKETAQER